MSSLRCMLAISLIAFASCGAPDVEDVPADEPPVPAVPECVAPLHDDAERCAAGDFSLHGTLWDPCRACWSATAPIACLDSGDGNAALGAVARRSDCAIFRVASWSYADRLIALEPDRWADLSACGVVTGSDYCPTHRIPRSL